MALFSFVSLLPACNSVSQTIALSERRTDGGAHAVGAIAASSFSKRVRVQAFDAGKAIVTPSPTFDGLGFTGVTKSGTLFAVERRGNSSIDPSGQVAFYEWHGPDDGWVARGLFDSPWDDRNVAGGVAADGSIIVFLARYDTLTGRWVDMGYVRSLDDGASFSAYRTLPVGSDRWFSPYGEMIQLPGGRLMQLAYGNDGHNYRLRALFSSDNGATWSSESVVDRSSSARPSEAGAIVVGGTTASNARVLIVSRVDPGVGHAPRGGLMQYVSSNGGRTWTKAGFLSIATSRSNVSPWLAKLSGGRVALAWASRSSMTINVSIVGGGKVFRNRRAWTRPFVLYRSRLADQRPRQAANFGYPSIASIGKSDSDKLVVFFDASINDPGLYTERAQANTDLVVMRLQPRDGGGR